MDWNNLRTEILAETKDILQAEPNFNANEAFDLFVRVVEKKQLTEFKNALPFPTENYTGVQIKTARATLAGKFETYLKSIYELLSIEIEGELKVCLVEFFKKFGLLQLNKDSFKFFDKNHQTLISIYPATYFQGKMPFGKELKMAYDLRNAIVHKGKLYGNVEPANNPEAVISDVKDFVMAILFITHQFKKELVPILYPNILANYLQNQIQLYKEWTKKNSVGFVHIDGLEDQTPMDLFAMENTDIEEDTNENSEEDEEDFEMEIIEKRQGTIDYLRKNKVTERKMIIRGELGMGKTTTLFYLTSLDAQEALNDKNKSIPVHFFLKDFAEKDNLLQKTIQKLGIDRDLVLDLLKKGKINFFFDGLNEVRNTQIAEVNTQISNLLSDYPNNFYIISTRPQSYNWTFDDDFQNRKVPIFDLQKLNNTKIEEFLDKNGKQVKAKILETIQNNKAWRIITPNPLMLKMLITVAIHNKGNVPSEIGKIIRAFMDFLYEREKLQRRGNFDKQIFHLLLCHLAYGTRSLTNANASLDKDEYILPILKECKDSISLSEKKQDALAPTDLLDFLRIAVDMNILTENVENKNECSFTYELHQLYYFGEYAQKTENL